MEDQKITDLEGTEENVVSEDVAREEVDKWLDYKKVNQSRREQYQDAIDDMVNAISEGYLSIDEDYNWVHKLKFPFQNGKDTLVYRPRLTEAQLEPHMKGIKSDDSRGMIQAYIAALTGGGEKGLARGSVKKLDMEDMRVGRAIATFFI